MPYHTTIIPEERICDILNREFAELEANSESARFLIFQLEDDKAFLLREPLALLDQLGVPVKITTRLKVKSRKPERVYLTNYEKFTRKSQRFEKALLRKRRSLLP